MPNAIHVTPRLGRWAVVHDGEHDPIAEFDDHEQAEQFARDHARDHDESEIVIHARGGDVRAVEAAPGRGGPEDAGQREPNPPRP